MKSLDELIDRELNVLGIRVEETLCVTNKAYEQLKVLMHGIKVGMMYRRILDREYINNVTRYFDNDGVVMFVNDKTRTEK